LAFITRIYHDARSSECQIDNVLLILIPQSYKHTHNSFKLNRTHNH